jgi:hypothetical protein
MLAAVSSPPRLMKFLRFVHDRNPFYLLSALCMFVGFRIVLGAINSAPGDWKTLLMLMGTLQVYEVAIIALALFLIVKRGLIRDGWILLAIEALFLVDLTNLNAELFTAMPRLGTVVNSICFALAMVKIFAVVRVLGLRLSPGTASYISAQLAFLFGLPGLFWLMRSPAAAVSSMQIYAVWWVVALLIAGGVMLVKRVSTGDSPMATLPWRLYIVVPLISLLVHLVSQNRVYWVHFQPANTAPILLAAVVALAQSKWRWHRLAMPASMGLVLLSLIASLPSHHDQRELSTHLLGALVSPLRIQLLAATGVTALLALRNYSYFTAHIAAAYLLLAWLGATPGQMMKNGLRIARSSLESVDSLIPDTTLEWGFVAITGSFVLLAIGAVFSLRKRPADESGSPPAAI